VAFAATSTNFAYDRTGVLSIAFSREATGAVSMGCSETGPSQDSPTPALLNES
jgi:hypothetical protein